MSSKKGQDQKWNSLGNFLQAKEARERETRQEESNASIPNSTPVTPVTPVTTVTPVTQVRGDAAPARDFARVANSIVRDAIPAGLFTGKCKQLYDYLYTQTRGAIVPARSARIPTDRVMKGAGMSRHTFRAHIQRLIRYGLVEVEEKPGEHGGNLYTVNTPEEAETEKGNRSHRGHRGHTGDKVPMVQGSQSDPCDPCLNVAIKDSSDDAKTSFKTSTENDDDEAAPVVRALKKMIEEITGREATRVEYAKLVELVEVLTLEGKIAAARTTVSSAGPFLAEHLRRRLFKKDKQQLAVESAQSEPPAASVDAQACPDCAGVGWYYPGGKEKGMAKCKHPKLTETGALNTSQGQPHD